MQFMNCLAIVIVGSMAFGMFLAAVPSEGARRGLCHRGAPEGTINLLPFGWFS
jgi:hypothetical protein